MLISPNSFPDYFKLFAPNYTITAGTVNVLSRLLIIDCSGCFSKGNLYYNSVFALSTVAVLLLVSFLLSAHEYFSFLSAPVCSPGLPDTFFPTASLPDPMHSAVSVPCPVLSLQSCKRSSLPGHFHIHSSVVSDLRYPLTYSALAVSRQFSVPTPSFPFHETTSSVLPSVPFPV